MIERNFVNQKIKEHQIQEYISASLRNSGLSHTKLMRTPMGDKIIIYASRPSIVVGKKGENIKSLTFQLKKKFNLENPQIEINEVENIYLDAKIVAEIISSSMERFGSARFKGVGHKIMTGVMNEGALGVEILVSGKVPSARARTWRFYQGYLKKCGEIAITGVRKAYATAQLKSGTVGIQVSIMPATTILPDDIRLVEEQVVEEVEEEQATASKKETEAAVAGEEKKQKTKEKTETEKNKEQGVEA